MEKDANKAIEQRDKAQGLLSSLEKLKSNGDIGETQYVTLKADYQKILDSAVNELNAIREEENRLYIEEAKEALKIKEELKNLEARLKVGEISQIDYKRQEEALRKSLDKAHNEISHNKNWFQRHLNWTLIFGYLASGLATAIVVAIILAIASSILPETYLFSGSSRGLSYILFAIFSIPLALWYVREKGRSESHAAWLFLVGFGLIILLSLKNFRAEREKFERQGR